MINKVELGSVKSQNITPNKIVLRQNMGQQNFTGLQDLAKKGMQQCVKGIQKCEENPMYNVAVLDLATAILPRTFFETFIGSKKTDENGNPEEGRKLNLIGGFEAFRRESSGLLINCIIPSFIVIGAAKLLNKPIMGAFNKVNLTKSWANGDALDQIQKYYTQSTGMSTEDRMYRTIKSMLNDIEGVDGNIDKGGYKKFAQIFANDKEYDAAIRKMAKNIVSSNPEQGYTEEMYRYLVNKSGIAENIKFKNSDKFFANNLRHLCDSTGEVLHGIVKEGDHIKNADDLSKYFSKAKKLVNWKSVAGLGIIIPLAIAAQPINRWITHKLSGKKGAPIYNDEKERILTPEEKKKLTAEKFVAIPLMAGVAGLSMLMDRPSLKMFQFKNIFPTMDQARIISAATFSSRLAAAEDSNELKENTIRDIATFSSFYFLGDYAAKGIATLLEKHNKDGIKLINRLKNPEEGANIFKKFWYWAKHTSMKSTDELGAIADKALHAKARNMRAMCQLGNLAFSLLSLGVFIPIYTRTQSNKKEKLNQMAQTTTNSTTTSTIYSEKLMKNNSPAFKAFFG